MRALSSSSSRSRSPASGFSALRAAWIKVWAFELSSAIFIEVCWPSLCHSDCGGPPHLAESRRARSGQNFYGRFVEFGVPSAHLDGVAPSSISRPEIHSELLISDRRTCSKFDDKTLDHATTRRDIRAAPEELQRVDRCARIRSGSLSLPQRRGVGHARPHSAAQSPRCSHVPGVEKHSSFTQ